MYIIFYLFTAVFCSSFTELSKYGSVEVIPYTKVYLDISSFKTGEVISFEIIMDLFFASSSEQSSYTFQIQQVPASSYSDYSFWNNLPNVTNRNVTSDYDSNYIFSWDEVKEEGKNYIYMITPEPFYDFYSFWDKKIKIKNTGGTSDSKKLGIVLGIVISVVVVVVVIIIIIVIIVCYRKKKKDQNVVYNVQIQQQQPIPQQIYPQTNYEEPVIPGTIIPETVIPGTVIPETVIPETVIPETVIPETVIPQPAHPQPSYSHTGYPQPIYQDPIPITYTQPVNPQYLNPEPNYQINNSPSPIYTPQDNMPSSTLNRLNY